MVVDDVAADGEFIVTLRRHKGHRLLEATDGREGLAVVQAEHPDLVITDVLMPVRPAAALTPEFDREHPR